MGFQTVIELPRPGIRVEGPSIPKKQTQLLLHKAKQPYEIDNARGIPEILSGELLVQIQAVGLNPIDWKSAEYGFALPSFPCVNGREFVGRVIRRSTERSGIDIGDKVLSISTDYRDYRKSAFQEYAAVSSFNAVKLPSSGFHDPQAASVGVAFVAAAISLGICLGLTIPKPGSEEPLDLLAIARSQSRQDVPEDVAEEVFGAISPSNRPIIGDWILIYGASTVTAQVAIQFAKWGGLRVIAVADREKHRERLEGLGADIIIDRHDLDTAAAKIRSEVGAPIRFALDTIGADSAAWCQNILASHAGVRYRPILSRGDTNDVVLGPASSLPHLVCLTGAPKERNPNVRVHSVPIKLFHTNVEIGSVLAEWLSALFVSGGLSLPETVFESGGLDSIVKGLERLKSGEMSGKRLVVELEPKRQEPC